MKPVMRYMVVMVLLLTLFAQQASKLLLIADYYTNKAAYLARCENKFRPSLNCNGQCLLMKKMKAAEQKEGQSPERKIDWKTEVFSTKSYYYSIPQAIATVRIEEYPDYIDASPVDRHQSVFHPPSA